MNKWLALCLLLFIPSFFVTGCWDRSELNDRAFAMATGLDMDDRGLLHVSYQFALPSKLGGPMQTQADTAYQFYEVSGKTTYDSVQRAQGELSRQIFLGHRRAILIGEKMARHGLQGVLDAYSRNPDARLRTDLFVVKGEAASTELKRDYPFERLPALAFLRIHRQTGGHPGDTAFRDFLIDASSDTNCPTLLTVSQDKVTGRAIFNRDLKLVGFLVTKEAANRLWITGGIKHFTYTVYIPNGHGYLSLYIQKFRRKIVPTVYGDHVSFHIHLSGTAFVKGNYTSLDMLDPHSTRMIEEVFERSIEDEMTHMIHRVQTEYGTDIFRFGDAVHRRYPIQWKQLKKHWRENFSQADIHVSVQVKIKRVGIMGLPLHVSKRSKEVR